MKIRELGRYFAALTALSAPGWTQVGPLEIQSLTPPSGTGYATTFRIAVSDGKDWQSVANAGIRIGEGCLMYWDRNARAFFLADQSASG